MKASRPYSKLPEVWDKLGQDRHSTAMVKYTMDVFDRFEIKPMTGLDLCCGTGTAIKLFTDRGLIMSGLDGSAPMLAQAAAKLKGRGVRLYHKMLPKFRLLETGNARRTVGFDFVTSFYDSLNYLASEEDLLATFQSVHAHLNDFGWFIFDMNTPEALENIWGGQVYADARDDIAWVWKNEYNGRTRSAMCRTTTFVKKGKLWERIDEDHFERAYSNTTIKKLLRKAGFTVKGIYDCGKFEPADRETLRIAVVARKKK